MKKEGLYRGRVFFNYMARFEDSIMWWEPKYDSNRNLFLFKHIADNDLYMNLCQTVGNSSYAIIVDSEGKKFEYLEGSEMERFFEGSELDRKLEKKGMKTSIDIEKAGMALQGFYDVAMGLMDENPNIADVVRRAGQKMLGTSAHMLGFTFVDRSLYFPEQMHSDFLDTYLNGFDRAVYQEILR